MLVIAWHSYEKAACIIDTLRGQAFEQGVFAPALTSRGGIGLDIAGTAVQQTMIATGRAGVEVAFFQHDGADAPQGQIARQAGAGDTCTDDEHLCFQGLWRLHRMQL